MALLEGEIYILNEKAKTGLPNRIGERCVIIDCLCDSLNYDYDVEFDDGKFGSVKESELNKLTPEDIENMSFIFTGNKVKFENEIAKIKKIDYLNKYAEILFKDEEVIVTHFSKLSPVEMEIDNLPEFKFKVGDKVKAHTNDTFNDCKGVIKRPFLAGNVKAYEVVFEDDPVRFDEDELELVNEPIQEISEEVKTLSDVIGRFGKIGLEIGRFTDKKNKQYGSSVDATYKMIQALMERYEYDEENYLMPKDLLKHILLQVRMMDKINRVFNNPSGKGDSESPYRDLGGYSLIGIDMTEK